MSATPRLHSSLPAWLRLDRLLVALVGVLLLILPLMAVAGELNDYLPEVTPDQFFAGADRFGEPEGEPPVVPVYKGETLAGYVYLNSDFTSATGYSGKPIEILVGIDPAGVVSGLKLVDHNEPIVLIGIPEAKIVAALNGLIGKDLGRVATGADRPPQVDIVSGATVSVLVMGDSVVRSAVRLLRSNRLGATATDAPLPAAVARTVDMSIVELRDWETLVGDGSIRRLQLSVGDVTAAFDEAGQHEAQPETDDPEELFIDLYIAPVSVPSIGLSLLGEQGYERLKEKLGPDQQAIVVAGEGHYSFKGSGYVRGGIFDRIELLQDGQGVRFRDRNHTRLGDLVADGAPALPEIALFIVPADFRLDVTAPWELQLLVQRRVGTHDKATLPFNLGYTLPERYLAALPAEVPPATLASTADVTAEPAAAPAEPYDAPLPGEEPLWVKIWQMNTVQIGITGSMLLVLTGIFFFQDWLVRRPRLFRWVRRSFLVFTLVWLGWITNAQLSVVNVLTFFHALINDFRWEYFLAAPMIFILWAAMAAALLFWGRGAFCGWLCPYGALQELLNIVAQALHVPQVKVPQWLHERLWPIKYIIFLALFGLSLYSLGVAELFAEVEPFKTAIILKFARDWPFVIFALTTLAAGLFIERFYCRYLCPLGAALAIPAKLRLFDWLKRRDECGSPCQRCGNECPVQAIGPDGAINVNECIYCMHCQEVYHDDTRCPPLIKDRRKREKLVALSSPSTRPTHPGRPIFSHNGIPVPVSEGGTPVDAATARKES